MNEPKKRKSRAKPKIRMVLRGGPLNGSEILTRPRALIRYPLYSGSEPEILVYRRISEHMARFSHKEIPSREDQV